MRKQENWSKLSEFPDFADAYIRDFIESHPSMDRDGLQNRLNLFVFIWNGARNRYEKVARFMELAMREHVLLRYRDRMKRLLIRKCGGI